MKDLTSARWIKIKGGLFLGIGILAAALLLLEQPSLRTTLLLALAIWSFCRFYYFAFYVIEHYVDSSYRFAGLGSFVGYLLKRKQSVPAASCSAGAVRSSSDCSPAKEEA